MSLVERYEPQNGIHNAAEWSVVAMPVSINPAVTGACTAACCTGCIETHRQDFGLAIKASNQPSQGDEIIGCSHAGLNQPGPYEVMNCIGSHIMNV